MITLEQYGSLARRIVVAQEMVRGTNRGRFLLGLVNVGEGEINCSVEFRERYDGLPVSEALDKYASELERAALED